ncbi:MAG: hypothetical protein SVR94_01995 [Pseudomonadota bacterium]|nr:hypothetical protein [Pseudomonadota bacterium]
MHFRTISVMLLLMLLTHFVSAADNRALRKMRSAFRSCESGLEMSMPKSNSALRVLQSRLKRYQRNRDSALNRASKLKDSEEEFYSGDFVGEKTFADLFTLCESQFVDKVAQAEAEISEKMEDRMAEQQQREAHLAELVKKNNAAKRQVVLAVNEYCAHYLRASKRKQNEELKNNYNVAKQKALTLYPDIVRQFHQATVTDLDTGLEKNFNKTIKAWFDFCDKVFADELEVATHSLNTLEDKEFSATVSDEGPLPLSIPSTQKPIDNASETQKTTTEDNADENNVEVGIDSEYRQTLIDLEADRRQILKKEGRLPDYIDDDEGRLKQAKTWQYETDEGDQCHIYQFKENKLVQSKTLTSECPPF